MLEIYELNKKFGDKEVVKNINFKVDAQEVLCILGPNGAGKSTTINMLTGTLAPNGGKILFAGKPIQENLQDYKQVLGVVPQEIALYEDLTALQNITFFASLYNIPKRKLNMKCMRALEYVGLGDRAKDRVKTYSGG
ncbi:ATP-binding cassette domain-containing protein [Erysipelothrix sp. HDW6C]|uniref:ATP-binding cassette domain-containing protein n=1 Tax=Erysipelothrix sp. HDW6C TaxID=2714930 RepID=UPI00196A3F18|nr:ABC transporter ATP-binding protein [Erysipelothrix sp. HDW6C]